MSPEWTLPHQAGQAQRSAGGLGTGARQGSRQPCRTRRTGRVEGALRDAHVTGARGVRACRRGHAQQTDRRRDRSRRTDGEGAPRAGHGKDGRGIARRPRTRRKPTLAFDARILTAPAPPDPDVRTQTRDLARLAVRRRRSRDLLAAFDEIARVVLGNHHLPVCEHSWNVSAGRKAICPRSLNSLPYAAQSNSLAANLIATQLRTSSSTA